MATVTASYNWVSGETVTPTKLNTAAAPTVVVADNEVTTSKILDANVTAEKLASNAVETAKIADDAVTNDKLSLAANAGEVKKALNADNAPPIFACRAWVNFDGTKDTTGAASTENTNRLIRGSGNVASVLRNGVGDYTMTFTTAMPDVNYAATAISQRSDKNDETNVSIKQGVSPSTATLRIAARTPSSAAAQDPSIVCVQVFR
jgi:hypothetical protein